MIGDRDPVGTVGTGGGEPDWSAASTFLRRRLRRLLPATDPEEVADLAQEALIDLVRTHRHEPVRNVEALLNTLARRKAIDFVRRRQRWGLLLEPLAGDGDAAPGAADPRAMGDPAERLRHIALELFARDGSECQNVARAYFAGYSWAEVAAADGRSELAVRKQWSRCLAHLRRILQTAPASFWATIVPREEGVSGNE